MGKVLGVLATSGIIFWNQKQKQGKTPVMLGKDKQGNEIIETHLTIIKRILSAV